MNVPSFTAEATVYQTRGPYRTVGTGAFFTTQVIPQLINSRSLQLGGGLGLVRLCTFICNCCESEHCSGIGVCIACALCNE